MTSEERQLTEIILKIIDTRRDQLYMNPSWVATEGLNEIDPERIAPVLVRLGCHLHLRQIARANLRKQFDASDEDMDAEPEFAEFKQLQRRYPTARSKKSEEPVYVLRDHMTDDDVAYNVARLRSEARAKLAHADALEAWGKSRGVA